MKRFIALYLFSLASLVFSLAFGVALLAIFFAFSPHVATELLTKAAQMRDAVLFGTPSMSMQIFTRLFLNEGAVLLTLIAIAFHIKIGIIMYTSFRVVTRLRALKPASAAQPQSQ